MMFKDVNNKILDSVTLTRTKDGEWTMSNQILVQNEQTHVLQLWSKNDQKIIKNNDGQRDNRQITHPASIFKIQDKNPIMVVRLLENAIIPTKVTVNAAGFDFHAPKSSTIQARKWNKVYTDIAIVCPPGTYIRITPRSGLAVNFGLSILAGVIDADFKGAIIIIIYNNGDTDFQINVGDKIAQDIVTMISKSNQLQEVETLPKTKREDKGFGSTGNRHQETVDEYVPIKRIPIYCPCHHQEYNSIPTKAEVLGIKPGVENGCSRKRKAGISEIELGDSNKDITTKTNEPTNALIGRDQRFDKINFKNTHTSTSSTKTKDLNNISTNELSIKSTSTTSTSITDSTAKTTGECETQNSTSKGFTET